MDKLCASTEIPENSAKAFRRDDEQSVFVVRKNGHFYGYINNCPHADWPLNLAPDQFLDLNKKYIQCSNHMALFEISSGNCVAGPCVGSRLERLDIQLKKGELWIAT